MNTEIIKENTETTESKMQFILDENGELQEISKNKCKTVKYSIKYKLKSAFEVFVHVDGTENYWISDYGRCVNNLNRKDKNTFYKHKEGKCHYTVFEIERYTVRDKKGKPTGETAENRYKRETTPEDLVVDTFLVKYKGRLVEDKKVAKRILTRTHLVSSVPTIWKSIEEGKTEGQTPGCLSNFFSGKKSASISAIYNENAGSGSARKEAVRKRLDEISRYYNEFSQRKTK